MKYTPAHIIGNFKVSTLWNRSAIKAYYFLNLGKTHYESLLFFRIKEKLNPTGATDKFSFNIVIELQSYYQGKI